MSRSSYGRIVHSMCKHLGYIRNGTESLVAKAFRSLFRRFKLVLPYIINTVFRDYGCLSGKRKLFISGFYGRSVTRRARN